MNDNTSESAAQTTAPIRTRNIGQYKAQTIYREAGHIRGVLVPRDEAFSIRVFDGAQLVHEGTGGATVEEALPMLDKAFTYETSRRRFVRVKRQRRAAEPDCQPSEASMTIEANREPDRTF